MTFRSTRPQDPPGEPEPARGGAPLAREFGPPPSATRQDLIAARRGDRDALATLWQRHVQRLDCLLQFEARALPQGLRERLSREQLLQDAFVRAQSHLGSFEYRGHGSFGAWLATIVRNTFRSWLEQEKRRERLLPEEGSGTGAPALAAPTGSGGPATHAARNEQRERITEAMSRIRARDEQAFTILYLQYFMDLSLAEVHAELGAGKTYDAFRMHEVKHARQLLSQAFAELGIHPPG